MGIFKKIIDIIMTSDPNKQKGKYCEYKVSRKPDPLIFGKEERKGLENVFIKDSFGNTYQIDHIEIRHNGIFCIETKNIPGYIEGGPNDEYWYQYIGRDTVNPFRNPLIQNKSHVNKLKNIIEENYEIHSIVVFTTNNIDHLEINNVINISDLKQYLKEYSSGYYLPMSTMENIYYQIKNSLVEISEEEHIKNIERRKDRIEKGLCPNCGGYLIIKENKHGKFYGCSNFPKCKYYKPINESKYNQ